MNISFLVFVHCIFNMEQYTLEICIYIFQYSMIRNSGVMLKDIRNMRKNNTITLSMTSKQIPGSTKDLKKVRSSQQINLRGFLDNKNQKIKSIDHKLEVHQSEIQKNNSIIQELTDHLITLKDQLLRQKEKIQIEDKKNKGLRDEIQRTNKILRSKNLRIDQLNKKLDHAEKENEVLVTLPHKIEELSKANNQLRKNITTLDESLADKKSQLSEKDAQIFKLREKIKDLGGTKAQFAKLKALISERQAQIDHLKSQVLSANNEKTYQAHVNQTSMKKLSQKSEQLSKKLKQCENSLQTAKRHEQTLLQRIKSLQFEQKSNKSVMQNKEQFASSLKKQLEDFKNKFNQANNTLKARETGESQKIRELMNKIKDLSQQDNVNKQTLRAESEKYTEMTIKLDNLKKKSKNLEGMYQSMLPQIQCPFGHELNNPVTIIPCGHNYCLGCKKGYSKQCMLCSGKLKIQAVYRNQLMDDIINIVYNIRKVVQIIK